MSVFRRAAARRGTPADWLIVGLGNPGSEYSGSRHNAGAQAVERWASTLACELRTERREFAAVGVTSLGSLRMALACPTTFMNRSGESVAALVRRHGVTDPSRVAVIHDELDLEPGRVKVKLGGGTAGHNGLESIANHLGTKDFVRLRVGVGKPPHPKAGKKWVLARPSGRESELLDEALDRTVVALEALVRDGPQAAMNITNSAATTPAPSQRQGQRSKPQTPGDAQ